MARATVIIVEDEFLISDYLCDVCKDFGAEVVGVAYNADEAHSIIIDSKPDFVLMDVRLKGDVDGVDVAKSVYEKMPEVKIIFITGSNEPSTIERINTDHPYRILIKPINPLELREAIVGM